MSGNFDNGDSILRSFSDPEQWRHRPIMVKRSVDMLSQSASPEEKWAGIQPLDLHTSPPEISAIRIDNDHFAGTAYIIIRGISSTPLGMFGNQTRKMQSIVQGRFKHSVPFESVQTGQAFTGPLVNVPARWLMPAVLAVLSKFQPDLKLSVDGGHPYALSSLIATSQSVSISLPGSEPNIFTPCNESAQSAILENLDLLGHRFVGMSRAARKNFFANPKNLAIYQFEPDYVYTFDFYQHVLDFSNFSIDATIFQIDILKVLGVRPIQIMACIWTSPSTKGKGKEQNAAVVSAAAAAAAFSDDTIINHSDQQSAEFVLPPMPQRIGINSCGASALPDECPWTYLYNFEVWHERAPPPRNFLEREHRKCFEGASSAVNQVEGTG